MKRWHGLTLLTAMLLGLAGCITFIAEGDPRWDPPILSKEGCPDLDGVYHDKGFVQSHNIYHSYIKGKGGGLLTVERSLWKELRKNPYVSIQKNGDILEFVRLTETGDPHMHTIVHLDSPWGGCHNGALFLRGFVISNSRPDSFACGHAVAKETEFRKTPDGYLELRHRTRWWACSMLREPKLESKVLLFEPILLESRSQK